MMLPVKLPFTPTYPVSDPIMAGPRWRRTTVDRNLTVTARFVSEGVLFVRLSGYADLAGSTRCLTQVRQEVLAKKGLVAGLDLIVDLAKLRGASRRGRLALLREIRRARPDRLFIYGASPLQKLRIRLNRRGWLPGLAFVADYDEAIAGSRRARMTVEPASCPRPARSEDLGQSTSGGAGPVSPVGDSRADVGRYSEELLHYIRQIRRNAAPAAPGAISDDHPFKAVFDALDPIRDEMAEKRRLEDRAELMQGAEGIGTIAGGVAHDLNNILSGIVSYPDLLLTDMAPDSPMKAHLEVIRRSGEKAATIVNDLLCLMRPRPRQPRSLSLNDVIADYLDSPEFLFLQRCNPNVTVESELATDLRGVLGSRTHLAKVVMNLLANAADAMPEGGKIRVCTRNRCVEHPIQGYETIAVGDYAVVSIADVGVGISPGDRRRIFEPFYTRKVMGRGGTGLGMTIVWATVKEHGGFVDVTSAEGRGTTFTLYFPCTDAQVQLPASASPVEDFLGRGESILVVDDRREQRSIAVHMLQRLGYRVTAVASGEEAVEHLRDERVDLVVLDMLMEPGIDGLETYRRIRRLNPAQKSIVTSGFSASAAVREMQRLGAGPYVPKPYLIETIGRVVRAALEDGGESRHASP